MEKTHKDIDGTTKLKRNLERNQEDNENIHQLKNRAASNPLHLLEGNKATEIINTSRLYQIELFEKAKKGNIITLLETGAGKTLIAVMLLKHVLQNEAMLRTTNNSRPRKLGIFLVNSVPLVIQQSKVIASNIPYKVTDLYGDMKVDLWEKEKWDSMIEDSDIIVMTAQILLDMLRHSYINMDIIALLIFDECHHTRKSHPYSLIMSEFYFRKYTPLYEINQMHNHKNIDGTTSSISHLDRPKVFSMTAALIVSATNTFAAASNLELALDSKIFTVRQTDELSSFVNRPKEVYLLYPPAKSFQRDPIVDLIRFNCLESNTIRKLNKMYNDILNTLGPWCAMFVFRNFLEDSRSNLSSAILPDKENGISNSCVIEEACLERARNLFFEHQNNLSEDENMMLLNPYELDDNQITPKVKLLIKTLQETKANTDKFCGIVFVKMRSVAYALHLLLGKIPELNLIKSGHILGHTPGNSLSNLTMNFKQQSKTIDDFRIGALNLMIATSVAEEGLDIQPCNLVVRFDFTNSLTSYIQSRGRARSKNSQFIIMQEEGNCSEAISLIQLKKSEKDMVEFYAALPEDRLLHLPFKDESEVEDEHMKPLFYEVEKTGAILTLESSIRLIYYYCSTLPHDRFCDMSPRFDIEEFDGFFQCTLKLPSNSLISQSLGESCKSKKLAKQLAAFKICIELHKIGQLNNHLLPLEVPDVEDIDSSNLTDQNAIEGTWRAKREYSYKIPDFWTIDHEASDQLFINMVDTSHLNATFGEGFYCPLAIITRKKLSDLNPFQLFFKSKPLIVNLIPSNHPITLNLETLSDLHSFTLLSFKSIFNKEFECNLDKTVYFIAPLKTNFDISLEIDSFSIDWALVKEALYPPLYNDLTKLSSELMVCDKVDNNCRYFVKKVRYDINSMSNIERQFEGSSFNMTLKDFYDKKFKKSVQDLNQPILEVERANITLDYLQLNENQTSKKFKSGNAVFLLPEFVEIYALPSSIFRSLMLVPSIMTRLDSLLLVQEAKCILDLNEIDDNLLLEAFSLPSSNATLNYERLEFLGDSFLKVLISMVIFLKFPKKHEGQMSFSRTSLINNRFLSKIFRDKNLSLYITSNPFVKQRFLPPNFKVKDKQADENELSRSISDKSLADVLEATLGAALLSGGEELGMKCARAIGIPLDPFKDWNGLISLSFNSSLLSRHEIMRHLYVEVIEDKLGYKFQNPSLLLEAFTHASYPTPLTPCYQRLEFLGDAVLDYLVTLYVYHKYPKLKPGKLTLLKHAAVSNTILAAIMETLDLHRHIIHFSNSLMRDMRQFLNTMEDLKNQSSELDTKEYWLDIKAPKVLADVLEAILGAILIDSQFNLNSIRVVFEKLFLPTYDKYLDPNTITIHPISELYLYFQSHRCENFKIISQSSTSQEDTFKFNFHVILHGEILASGKGNLVNEAKKQAAANCLKRIDKEPLFWKQFCDCSTLSELIDEKNDS